MGFPKDRLTIRLFGRFSIARGERLEEIRSAKVQELLCYLLLHRERPHAREALASLLWRDVPTSQSKKYLRQALWQLQAVLRKDGRAATQRALVVDALWVRLDTSSGLSVDVEAFSQAAALARRVGNGPLGDRELRVLSDAVGLYRGELLEGWYQDWCLFERERLQADFLRILDGLIAHCERQSLVEEGLRYGTLSLRCDPARESTHQSLMRMYYLAGDRSTALRQYDRCVIALDEELGVKPSAATAALYERLRDDSAKPSSTTIGPVAARNPRPGPALSDVLRRLREIETLLVDTQQRLRADISLIEHSLASEKSPVVAVPLPSDPPRLRAMLAPAAQRATGRV